MPTPLSNILIAFGITISAVEDSIFYGAIPFILAALNEILRTWAVSTEAEEGQ